MLPALTKPALLPQTTSAPNMEVTSSEHHKSAQEREAKIFPGINYFNKRIVYCPTQLALYLSTDQYQGHDLLVVYMGYIKGVQNSVCSRICLAYFLGHILSDIQPVVLCTFPHPLIPLFGEPGAINSSSHLFIICSYHVSKAAFIFL